ncbi:Putative AMP-dependent synthetase/ligase, AMP-binding, AMP-binding enzyme domain, ANL [Septoria linicola]|uniref:AMP-dependent synthetase/ligase, AMP-binding, AMP-binding enzyme domain, ANL n=1 Tax=Septoria linicola TaxID=215465 RepID=A0A9Q9ACS9_9PEZI|nr:putative AMP-dependent synthetase/ligase, AMP-binding, AMP-binding enzyme domain, ANL [Septoria linicola]USW47179.1 Putative AMP-dependent synthetase/ligase, AMP-binding, AMP-binding enzyme domain, ANL [Septoria linicola]
MPIRSTLPDVDIPQCNLLSFLFPTGKAEEDKLLWIDAANPDNSLTASQALHLIKRFACGLDKLHIPKHAPVMVVAPNSIYTPVVYLAVIGSGRVFTAANPDYTVSELVHQMKTAHAAVVLADPSVLPKVQKAAAEASVPGHRVYQFPVAADAKCDVTNWQRILASDAEAKKWTWDNLEGQASKDTVAVINFSSGTTGQPKGVCTTHYNWVSNALQIIHARLDSTGQTIECPDPDRWLTFLPWYHAYAQMFTMIVACKLRQKIYTMSRFQLEPYLAYIAKYKITNLQLVPPVLIMMNKRQGIEELDLTSVNWIMSAAAPLKRDLQNDISKKLKATIVQSYGMTETTCTALMIPGLLEDDSGSAGLLLPSTEAMLVDEDGKEVPAGQSGELWVRGPQMLKCYWENEPATRETYAEGGWLKTGDVAEYKDAKFWIVDRRKELIKVKGYQVAPAELEALLLEHDDIADAAVVGLNVEDEERPRAYVKLQSPSIEAVGVERGIKRYVAKRAAKHKHLTGGVVIVDAIPRLLSGKIQRKVVKEWAKRDALALESKVTAKL